MTLVGWAVAVGSVMLVASGAVVLVASGAGASVAVDAGAVVAVGAGAVVLVAVGAGAGGSVGFGAGVMITENVPLPVLPDVSVAVQVTGVVPTAKELPEAGSHVGVRSPSTSSVALTPLNATATEPEASACIVILAGTETTGAVVSLAG